MDRMALIGGPIAGMGFVMALAVSFCAPANALERTIRFGSSDASFRKVGTLSKELTRLCREGQFNQIRKDALYIGYVGPGPGRRTLTGIAQQGYNLIDPTGKAQPMTTYHFHNDGFSDCSVYVAREGDPPNPR